MPAPYLVPGQAAGVPVGAASPHARVHAGMLWITAPKSRIVRGDAMTGIGQHRNRRAAPKTIVRAENESRRNRCRKPLSQQRFWRPWCWVLAQSIARPKSSPHQSRSTSSRYPSRADTASAGRGTRALATATRLGWPLGRCSAAFRQVSAWSQGHRWSYAQACFTLPSRCGPVFRAQDNRRPGNGAPLSCSECDNRRDLCPDYPPFWPWAPRSPSQPARSRPLRPSRWRKTRRPSPPGPRQCRPRSKPCSRTLWRPRLSLSLSPRLATLPRPNPVSEALPRWPDVADALGPCIGRPVWGRPC